MNPSHTPNLEAEVLEVPWTVGDVMTTNVVTVGVGTDFKTCVDLLRVHRGVVGVDNPLSFHLDDTHVKAELAPIALQPSARERQQ